MEPYFLPFFSTAGETSVSDNFSGWLGEYLADAAVRGLQLPVYGTFPQDVGYQPDWTAGQTLANGVAVVIAAPGTTGKISYDESVVVVSFANADGVDVEISSLGPHPNPFPYYYQLVLAANENVIQASPGDDTISTLFPYPGTIDDALVSRLTYTVDLGAGDDAYVGALNAFNHIVGNIGDDSMTGGAVDDAFDAGQGNDRVDGGAGFDVVFVHGDRADYQTSIDGGVVTLGNTRTGETTVLENTEYLHFESGETSVTVTSAEAELTVRLYEILLNRDPDAAGIEHYLADQSSGNPALDPLLVASVMIDGGEFFEITVDARDSEGDLGNAAFLDTLYDHAFGRDGDAEGTAYWLSHLAGGLSQAEVAVEFAASAEADAYYSDLTYLHAA